MKIVDVITSNGLTGFFFDDQAAIKRDALKDGEYYHGMPFTPGFSHVRQPGESLSVMLLLEDGQIAWGDCAVVQYSGTAGRDPLFIADKYKSQLEDYVTQYLVGKEITSFRQMTEQLENYRTSAGQPMHKGISYGLSQAILEAVAKANHSQMCEVIAQEYGLEVSDKMIPIFCQTGDFRYDNADKIILKQVAIMPHGLFNNIPDKIGQKGEKLVQYIEWLRDRILSIRPNKTYQPILHIDVYGNLGDIFEGDAELEQYLVKLSKLASPFRLRIEGPIDRGNQAKQIEELKRLTHRMDQLGGPEIVADEWCNTLQDIKLFADKRAGHMIQIKTPDLGGIQNCIEAVLYCKEKDIDSYLGGTCNETAKSAEVCTHLAMALSPKQVLAKPGMGVDEGLMIVYNEMSRILAIRRRNQSFTTLKPDNKRGL